MITKFPKFISFFVFLLLLATLAAPTEAMAQKKKDKKKSNATADSLLIIAKRKNAALFSDGLKEKLAGNDSKALEKFEEALVVFSDDAASMYEITELLAKQGRIDEGIVLMKKAILVDPNNEWYLIRLAQLYKAAGKPEEYAQVYRNLLKISPENIEYIGELSSALVLTGNYKEAIELYDAIEKQIGVNETLSIQKQSIYYMLEKPEKAGMEIEKLSATFPYESRYLAMLAEHYKKYGPAEKSLEVYRKIIANDPDDPYAYITLAENLRDQGHENEAFDNLLKAFESPALEPDNKVQIMFLWFEGKDYTDTLNQQIGRVAEILVRVHPENPRGYQLYADVYFRNQEWKQARNYLLQALSFDKNNYQMWESLLYADIQLLEFDLLDKHATETISLFPEQALPYLFKGIAAYQSKDYEGALKQFEAGKRFVVRNDQLLAEFYSNTADTYHRLKNDKASDAAYEKALTINPDNALVLNNYAYYLSIRGENLERAKQMSEKSLQLQPENPSYLDTYAWILFKLADYQNALPWIEKALEKTEDKNATLFEHCGDILFHLGRTEEAIQYWMKAAEAGDASELIQKKIKDGRYYE